MRVLSFVEKGWGGARELSIALSRRSVPVEHLVNDPLPPDVVAVITPYPGVTIAGVPRRLFPWYVCWRLAVGAACGNVGAVLFDYPKTERWVSRAFPMLRNRLFLITEGPGGAWRLTCQGRPAEPGAVAAG